MNESDANRRKTRVSWGQKAQLKVTLPMIILKTYILTLKFNTFCILLILNISIS